MDLLCRSPRLLCLATSVCIWNRRKKKRNVQKDKYSFFASSKVLKESLKTIHQKSKWTYFAGPLGCSTWQQVSASGTEGIRREMCKKKKIPSLLLVNCGKKIWNKFTKIPNGPSLPVSSAALLGNKCLHLEQKKKEEKCAKRKKFLHCF